MQDSEGTWVALKKADPPRYRTRLIPAPPEQAGVNRAQNLSSVFPSPLVPGP